MNKSVKIGCLCAGWALSVIIAAFAGAFFAGKSGEGVPAAAVVSEPTPTPQIIYVEVEKETPAPQEEAAGDGSIRVIIDDPRSTYPDSFTLPNGTTVVVGGEPINTVPFIDDPLGNEYWENIAIAPGALDWFDPETSEYDNPIDAYFYDAVVNFEFNGHDLSMAGWKDYVYTYRGVWRSEFYNVIKWLLGRCIYEEDREAIAAIKDDVEAAIYAIENANFCRDWDFFADGYSPGVHTNDGRAQTTGLLYAAMCKLLIEKTQVPIYGDGYKIVGWDEYKYMERDYANCYYY